MNENILEPRLLALWQSYRRTLETPRLNEILDRGICYSVVNEPHPVLVAGINPSFREGDSARERFLCPFDYRERITDGQDRYFRTINDLFPPEWQSRVAYLDILNYRETQQTVANEFIKATPDAYRSLEFFSANLALNQLFIEQVIRPRLVIVKNTDSWRFWGKEATPDDNIWMGYRFESLEQLPCGELCRVTGLVEHPDRVSYRSLLETNLRGTLVLFTCDLTRVSADKRPTPELVARLCQMI